MDINKNSEVQAEEIIFFYLWLRGQLKSSKQHENLMAVYVACPNYRTELLREFLQEYKAEHRYFPLKRALIRNEVFYA